MIAVVDEHHNEIGVTYSKRAKGMVKNGRARYINDSKICMFRACPPDKTEDNIMNEHINSNEVRDNDGNIVKPIWKDAETLVSVSGTLTMADILSRIDMIIGSDDHINRALDTLKNLEIQDVMHGSNNAGKKAEAIRDTVRAREETKHKILEFLNKMYDDIRSVKLHSSLTFKENSMKALESSLKVAIDTGDNVTSQCIIDAIKELIKN